VSKAMRDGGGSSSGGSFGGGSRSGGGGRGDEHGWRCRWLCAAGHAHEEKSRGLAGTAKKPQTQRRACEYIPTYHWLRPWASQPQPPQSHRTHTTHAHTAPRAARVRTTRPPGTQTLAPGCPSPRASHPGGTACGGCAIIQFHRDLLALSWRERANPVTPYCNSKRGCEVGALCRSKSCAARPCTWSSYRTHRQ
jgi:hypothetical protein